MIETFTYSPKKTNPMSTKMTFGGIGPKLALITLPYLVLAILVMQRDPQFFKLPYSEWITIVGYTLLGTGFLFYIATIVVFLTDFKKGLLVTRGTFGLCRNPIYASFIVFFIPGLALLFQSGMILSIALVLYLNFKISIHGENKVLERTFGEAYEDYRKSVNDIVPFPRFRIRRK
jgi:protein-S-isoprenylcysteine O-methyltransferase Ste14